MDSSGTESLTEAPITISKQIELGRRGEELAAAYHNNWAINSWHLILSSPSDAIESAL
jgi:hypothetical protein